MYWTQNYKFWWGKGGQVFFTMCTALGDAVVATVQRMGRAQETLLIYLESEEGMPAPTREVVSDNGMISVRPSLTHFQPPGAGSPLLLNPDKTAVVIVDVQRFFTETPPFSAMRQIVPRIARLLQAARKVGMTVAHVKTEFCADMRDAGRLGSRTREMMDGICGAPGEKNPLLQGSPLADLVPELAPEPADIVVTKTRFSGFSRTNLDELLKAREIESLIFTGGTTTVCLESTLRDALFCEYNALVLSDCAIDMTPELHESALARIELFFGWVCSSEELISAMVPAKRDAGL